jgi:hypothetical protein
MLRAGRLLPPQGLSTPRFDAGRFPPTPAACYQAPWRLPGPDFHRLADTRLCAGQLISTPPLIDMCPRRWAHENAASASLDDRGSRAGGREGVLLYGLVFAGVWLGRVRGYGPLRGDRGVWQDRRGPSPAGREAPAVDDRALPGLRGDPGQDVGRDAGGAVVA